MGSLTLLCPMCCGETFNNPESLKSHLLSVTGNLNCPACTTRIYSMAALIQHLDTCGRNSDNLESVETIDDDPSMPEDMQNDKNDMMEDDDVDNESFMATVTEDGIMMVGEGRTIQVDENGDIQVLERDSSMDKNEAFTFSPVGDIDDTVSSVADRSDLMNEDDSTIVSVSQADSMPSIDGINYEVKIESDQLSEKDQGNGVSVYSCSTCGVSFSSVLDHIKQFHDGQEVVLEMGDQQLKDLENESEVISTTGDTPASPLKPSHTTKTNSSKAKQSMNTIRTEECIDNEGRVYTRKVVQIERFWDRAPVNVSETKAPMIEKFFSNVEGVKVRDKSVTVAPTQMYRCTQCLEQFAKLNDFQIHFCLQKSNRCDQCDQTFATMKLLQAHMKSHENSDFPSQKIFLCIVCGTEFLTHKSLRLHSRMHAPVKSRHVDAPEGSEEETFVCVECGTTLSESYRAAHMALHAGDPITCSICNRKFDSTESLAMHAAVHSEAANPQLINSSNTIDQSISITSPDTDAQGNLLSSENIDETVGSQASTVTTVDGQAKAEPEGIELLKPYQCQHCGRRFTRPHEKVKHERIHTGEKPHSCEVCGKKFRVSYCLTLHMRTHTGVRPYECQHCGKRFKASSVYNHHLLTHGDERAYTCPYCPKTFKTRVQLAGHKNSHTKPFRCTECSRPFASLYAARAHIQTHKKDNNLKFACSICGASYGRAFALKDHVKQHEHENSLIPPEPAREEEVQELDNFLMQDEEVELIVPSPPPPPPCDNELDDV